MPTNFLIALKTLNITVWLFCYVCNQKMKLFYFKPTQSMPRNKRNWIFQFWWYNLKSINFLIALAALNITAWLFCYVCDRKIKFVFYFKPTPSMPRDKRNWIFQFWWYNLKPLSRSYSKPFKNHVTYSKLSLLFMYQMIIQSTITKLDAISKRLWIHCVIPIKLRKLPSLTLVRKF